MKKTLTTGWECPENDNKWSCVINEPMLSQYRVYQCITTGKHTMKTLDKQISSNLSKNMFEHSISQSTVTIQQKENYSQNMKKSSETEKTHTFFLKIGEGMMQKWSLRSVTRSVSVRFSWERNGEDSEQSQKFKGKTEKVFKNCLQNAKHAFFATEVSRQQVAMASHQNTKKKNWKKFSKCFSWLEGLLVRESRAKPRKSLCTLRDWTIHSRTSRQNQHASSRL